MERFTLLPSVNWNPSHIFTLNETGTMAAYGSRSDLILMLNMHQNDLNKMGNKIIEKAHSKKGRVTALKFIKHKVNDEFIELLVSCGDDGNIKVWNTETLENTHRCNMNRQNVEFKFVDMDCFPKSDVIVAICEQHFLVKWDLSVNKAHLFKINNKLIMTCVSACPHNNQLVAIGSQRGRLFVYDLYGEGNIKFKIACHSNDITSISWCPVPYNVIELLSRKEDDSFNEDEFKKDETLLLATTSRDRYVYICKAGTDGYSEVLSLPQNPLNSNKRYSINRYSSYEKSRYIKWISPYNIIMNSDFYEIALFKIVKKNETSTKKLTSRVQLEPEFLHQAHKQNINCFDVHLTSPAEPNFKVYSCSMDHIIARCTYNNHIKSKPLIFNQISGFVFSLDMNPTVPDMLAIGTGDSKVHLWDLSCDNSTDVVTISKNINSKVMCLKWHPTKEGILAFGTFEGRVGIFDLSLGTSNIKYRLFKTYHNKPIYKLSWATTASCKKDRESGDDRHDSPYLFALGNNHIMQYNPENEDEDPTSWSSLNLTDIGKKSDVQLTDFCMVEDHNIIIGFNNGDIHVLDKDSYKVLHTINDHTKSIMSLVWHPKYIIENTDEISAYSNWIATAGEHVFVYDIDTTGESKPKKIASMELHSNRVLELAWNPHINGRLLSCSGDKSVIIWDVISQTVIGRYLGHTAQVYCGVWSMTNKDIAITGATDFTCRVWSVSRDTTDIKRKDFRKSAGNVIEAVIINVDGRERKKETAVTNGNVVDPISTKRISPSSKNKNCTFLPSITHQINICPKLPDVANKMLEKHGENDSSVSGTRSHFTPTENLILNGISNEYETCENVNGVGNENGTCENGDENSKPIQDLTTKENEPVYNSNHNYAQLFGSGKEFMNLIQHEEETLRANCSNNEFVLIQSRCDLKTRISNAIQSNEVTEHMIALACSVSPKLWRDACQAYIEQLLHSQDIMQAVNFMLAMNDDEKAINLLCDKNLFKEALTIARLRYEDKDQMCRNVLQKWIQHCASCGNFRLGAHCYLYLNEEENAAMLLMKSKSFGDGLLAAKMLKKYNPDRAIELASDVFKRHLSNLKMEEMQELLTSFPEIKYVKAWYLSYRYLVKEQANTASVTKWLIGMLNNDDASALNNIDDTNYESLKRIVVVNSFHMTSYELMIYASAQLALYISALASGNSIRESAVKHLVKGLFYCYNFRTTNTHKVQNNSGFPMMKLLQLVFPKGVMKWDNCCEHDTSLLMKNVCAYFCEFVVTWLINCDELPKSLKKLEVSLENNETAVDDDDDNGESCSVQRSFQIIKDKPVKMRKLLELLTAFKNDIISDESIAYYKNTNCIREVSADEKCGNGLPSKEESNKIFTSIKEAAECNSANQLAPPNPYAFVNNLRLYADNNKDVDEELSSQLNEFIEEETRKLSLIQ